MKKADGGGRTQITLVERSDGCNNKKNQRHMYMSVNGVTLELNLEFAVRVECVSMSGGFLGLANENVFGQASCMMSPVVIVGLMMWVPITCFRNWMERRMVNGVVTKSRWMKLLGLHFR